ncbi:metallopeptidase TldD-related protein [Myxococcaceae bacterium GXIMD 01537]
MDGSVLFIERRQVARYQPGAGEGVLETDAGFSVTEPGEGARHSRFGPLDVASVEERLRALPRDVRVGAATLLESPGLDPLAPGRLAAVAAALSRAGAREGATQVDCSLREMAQQVLCGPVDAPVQDMRRHVVLEVRVRVEQGDRSATLQREAAFADTDALEAGLPALEARLSEYVALARLRCDAVPAPREALTVVLPPGADAGVLFHEVCGHPLEGDVVARGASYLAAKLGEPVGPEWLSVVDDPLCGPGTQGYRVDDEGAVARKALLVHRGRVEEPLLDTEMARRLGRAPNGHGRRVSWRHYALPRMSHTAVEPHAGRFEELVGGVARGLLVRGLTPRHVNLMTGEFSFYIDEARELRDGREGAFIGPALLRGDGLSVLAGIEAVGEDRAEFFGLKGCGKLDHGALPVSFGNPTVRIRGLTVTPWE